MSDREYLGSCETCGKRLYDGDAHEYTADGCWLCSDHAANLSDALRQHREILADPDTEFPMADFHYDTREEMTAAIKAMEAEITTTGDRTLAHT